VNAPAALGLLRGLPRRSLHAAHAALQRFCLPTQAQRLFLRGPQLDLPGSS
jgi:hypothetical protein